MRGFDYKNVIQSDFMLKFDVNDKHFWNLMDVNRYLMLGNYVLKINSVCGSSIFGILCC